MRIQRFKNFSASLDNHSVPQLDQNIILEGEGAQNLSMVIGNLARSASFVENVGKVSKTVSKFSQKGSEVATKLGYGKLGDFLGKASSIAGKASQLADPKKAAVLSKLLSKSAMLMSSPEVKQKIEKGDSSLRKGAQGPAVRMLQIMFGTPGLDPKGAFGENTENSVKKFQKALKIPVTGVWDPATATAKIKADSLKGSLTDIIKSLDTVKKGDAKIGSEAERIVKSLSSKDNTVGSLLINFSSELAKSLPKEETGTAQKGEATL
jgi:hypothetical protein